MMWQVTPHTIPLIVIAAISAISALDLWRHRVPWAKTGALLILASAEWMLGSALEIGSADLPTKVFWGKVQYVGMVIVPTAWLVSPSSRGGLKTPKLGP